jgi:transcriptional regulator with XRE-family HTH domain
VGELVPVGLAIALRRAELGETAEQVAELLGVSRGFLSLVEAGRRLPPNEGDFITAAARYLGWAPTAVAASICTETLVARAPLWLRTYIVRGVTAGFKAAYLLHVPGAGRDLWVLSPPDPSRRAAVKQVLKRHLHGVGRGQFVDRNCALQHPRLGGEVEVVGHLRATEYVLASHELFPARDCLVFVDSITFGGRQVLEIALHAPGPDNWLVRIDPWAPEPPGDVAVLRAARGG